MSHFGSSYLKIMIVYDTSTPLSLCDISFVLLLNYQKYLFIDWVTSNVVVFWHLVDFFSLTFRTKLYSVTDNSFVLFLLIALVCGYVYNRGTMVLIFKVKKLMFQSTDRNFFSSRWSCCFLLRSVSHEQ